MAGGEGSPRRRRASKSIDAVAPAPQAPLRSCSSSTKRKAGKAAAAASDWLPRPSGRKENRLPAKDIRWILAQEPQAPPRRFAALKRRNPELVPRAGEEADEDLMALYGVTRAFYEMQERLPKLQAWVRGELKEKGYVEVDDEWFKGTAEAQAAIDREWPRVKAKLDRLRMMDDPSVREGGDESENDDSEEEEDEEDALVSVMKDYLL